MEAITVLLRDLVAERTGIFVDDQSLDIFMDKLSPLVLERSFGSILDYYYLLKYDTSAADEWPRVIDAISTRETFFWREFAQIRSLVEQILPQFFRHSPTKRFRIWSAACASGEEPLTIAMAISEAGLDHFPIDILASDASPAAIASARRGIYRERSFRNLDPRLRDKYFTRVENGWKAITELHQRVCWTRANLLKEEDIVSLAVSNVIFCRNVFIYFQPEVIKRVIETFARFMLPPAYLFVGAPESLLRLTTRFELREFGDAFGYARLSGGEQAWIA